MIEREKEKVQNMLGLGRTKVTQVLYKDPTTTCLLNCLTARTWLIAQSHTCQAGSDVQEERFVKWIKTFLYINIYIFK